MLWNGYNYAVNCKYPRLSCFEKGWFVVTACDRSQQLLFVFLALHKLPGQVSSPDRVYRQAHILQEAQQSQGCLCPVAASNSHPPQGPLPCTTQQIPTLSAKCLMIKALFDIRGFSKRAHLFK